MQHNRLGKQNILRGNEIPNAFRCISHRIHTQHFDFLIANRNDRLSSIGIFVAKKKAKLSVKRNLCRRIIKEAFRTNKPLFSSKIIIAVAARSVATASKDELWDSISQFINEYKAL